MATHQDTLNFIYGLNTEEGQEKIAAVMTDVIRSAIRAERFCSQILAPKPVSKDELIPDENKDQVYKLVQLEPKTRAMTVTFNESPVAQFIGAKRIRVPFYKIKTEKYEKTEEELLAYSVPITDWIKKDMTYNIQSIEDHRFLTYVEIGIQKMQYEANGGAWVGFNRTNVNAGAVESYAVVKGQGALASGADDFVIHPVQREDLVDLFKLIDGKELKAEAFIITTPDHDDLMKLTMEDVGSQLAGEVFVNGINYKTVMNRRMVVVPKTRILRPGNIYAFTSPEYLGVFYTLQDIKFFVKKEGELITWWAWEVLGMALVNINGMAKLELYSGSVTPTAKDTGHEKVEPVPEEDLVTPPTRPGSEEYVPEIQF